MSKLTCQLGVWSAGLLLVLGAGYLALLVGLQITGRVTEMTSAEPAALFAGIDTLLTAIGLVILMACLVEYAAAPKKVLGILGLSFTLLFTVTVIINRFAQLTVVRQSILNGDTADLDRFLTYGSRSVFFSLEILGWGFFLSLATLFVAPLFTGGRLERWISRLLILYSILGFTSVLGYAFASPLILVGFAAWGPVLAGIIILLWVLFRRMASPFTSLSPQPVSKN